MPADQFRHRIRIVKTAEQRDVVEISDCVAGSEETKAAHTTGLESKLLMKIPGYAMIKGIKSGFDSSDAEGMRPVALQLGSAERIALEIEKLPDGRSMIYIPSAPSAWSGITQILPADHITYLDVPVTKVLELTEKFGHGADAILKNKLNKEDAQPT